VIYSAQKTKKFHTDIVKIRITKQSWKRLRDLENKCSWITVTSLKIHGIFVTTFLLYFSSPFISQSFSSTSVCPIIFLQLWQKRNNYFTALGFLNHHVKMCCDSSHMRFFSKFSKNESVFCSILWNTEIIFWFDFQKFFIFPHYCTVVEQLTWTKLRFQDY